MIDITQLKAKVLGVGAELSYQECKDLFLAYDVLQCRLQAAEGLAKALEATAETHRKYGTRSTCICVGCEALAAWREANQL